MSHGVVGESTARAVRHVVGEHSQEWEPVHVVGRSQSQEIVASRV